MVRPQWVTACALDEPDESEAQLTALDLAARPPAKLGIVQCLLACGATPTASVILILVRNPPQARGGAAGDGLDDKDGQEWWQTTRGGPGAMEAGGIAAVRECFLGAVVGTEWATNPLIPGMNLSVVLTEAILQACATLYN